MAGFSWIEASGSRGKANWDSLEKADYITGRESVYLNENREGLSPSTVRETTVLMAPKKKSILSDAFGYPTQMMMAIGKVSCRWEITFKLWNNQGGEE